MKEFIEYICTIIEEKYSVQMVNGPICTQDRGGLPCICISGEMLSQALNGLLGFIKKPEYFSKLIAEDDVFFPVIMKKVNGKEKIYISINRRYVGLFESSEISREYCFNTDNEYYIKLHYHENAKDKNVYLNNIKNLEEKVYETYEFLEHYSRNKYKFVVRILSKIRVLNNRKATHFAFYELMLFLSPVRMHGLLEKLLKDNQLSRDQAGVITDFLVKHTDFIIELGKEAENETINLEQFASAFLKIFHMDLSYMIAVHLEEGQNIQELVKMLSDTLLTNLRKVSTRPIKNEVDMLKNMYGEEFKNKLNKIENNLKAMVDKNEKLKNRSLPSKYAT